MEFELHADGSLTPLPKQNIDTGLGLERGARILQQVPSVFDTDGYQEIMHWIAGHSGVAYGDSEQATKAHRILADHGRGMTFLDADGFKRLMEEQRQRSRRAVEEVDVRVTGEVRSQFVGYEKTDVLTAILAYEHLGARRFQAKLEQSPFYPEGGGQVSDSGFIENEETGARAELVAAARLPGDDQVLTFEGEGFAEGVRVRAVVPWSVRFPTMANHTATHLLHKALQEVLGERARQAGSAV